MTVDTEHEKDSPQESKASTITSLNPTTPEKESPDKFFRKQEDLTPAFDYEESKHDDGDQETLPNENDENGSTPQEENNAQAIEVQAENAKKDQDNI